jgi:hypothetical protein
MIVFPTAQEAGDAAAEIRNDKSNKHFHCIPEQLLDSTYIVGVYVKVYPKDTTLHKDFQLKFVEWL